MSIQNNTKTGVIIMTYGSATTAPYVREYFESIYKGKASDELIKDFENRYTLVGRSPLIDITKKQASLLQEVLGTEYVVRAGMRHGQPSVDGAIAECKSAGATKMVGIVLSPQFSSFIMEGYKTAFTTSAQNHGFVEADTIVAGPWPTEPHFVELLSHRVQDALKRLKEKHGVDVPVVFTTHSLPLSVVSKDPQYLDQLKETIDATLQRLDSTIEWYAGYQSAGHTPEEWLKPDLVDILNDLKKKEDKAVLIVPIQFLADHLEILYDLDIAGREQCDEYGIEYNRIELPNTDSLFIESLAQTARETEKTLA